MGENMSEKDNFEILNLKVLKIDNWKTPVSTYIEEELDTARIKKVTYEPGYYFMEGVAGYDLFEVIEPIKVTVLEIKENGKWREMMVDDPLHDNGMRLLANVCRGTVLVAGLGLGLVVHHLFNNNKVDYVVVVEKNRDVIDIVSKYLKYKNLKIIHRDFFEYINELPPLSFPYDSAILDLWAWNRDASEEERKAQTNQMRAGILRTALISKEVYVWGIRDPDLNPAVTKEVNTDLMKILEKIGVY